MKINNYIINNSNKIFYQVIGMSKDRNGYTVQFIDKDAANNSPKIIGEFHINSNMALSLARYILGYELKIETSKKIIKQ